MPINKRQARCKERRRRIQKDALNSESKPFDGNEADVIIQQAPSGKII